MLIYILQLILGRAGSGRTTFIREKVKNFIDNDINVIIIVPEQSSFDTEKNMLNELDENKFQRLNVLSFTRLCDFVFRKVGSKYSKKLDDSGRNMLMSMAINEVEKEFKIYKKNSDSIEMIELMISTLKEFKMCKLDNCLINDTINKLDDGILKEKLYETNIIMNKYEELLGSNYSDPLDDLDILSKILEENNIFNGYKIFFDEFNGFTAQQMEVIKHIFLQADDVYMSFCTDYRKDNIENPISLFSHVNRTVKSIISLAKACKININEPIFLDKYYRTEGRELSYLEKNIFGINNTTYNDNVNDVFIYNACNIYDECNFIACKIKELVFSYGYRFKDFAVITRDICEYSEVIDNIFSKFDIQYFIDNPEPIINKTLNSMVLSAFDCVNSSYNSSAIFRYLKSGLTELSTEEISNIENYVLLWSINGEQWLSDFTNHPNGFGSSFKDKDIEFLSNINKLREKIITPLQKFKESIKNATGKQIAKSVYNLLNEVGVQSKIKSICNILNKFGNISEAEEQARLWDILMESLNQTAVVLGETKITPKRYSELLGVTMKSMDIAFIPRGLDEVTIGSIDRIRLSHPKITFIIGAVDGEFPHTPVQAGIFSDLERQKLISLGLTMYDTLESISLKERLLAYIAISSASDKLYISWPSLNSNGPGRLPSEIVKEVKKIFPKIKIIDNYSIDLKDKIWSEKYTFELCSQIWNDNSVLSETLKEYFRNNHSYIAKIESIERAVDNRPLDFIDSNKSKVLFGDKMRISASQIEKYYLCRFFYFCKYGLKAKERKPAKFNAMEYGSLIHFILEKFLSDFELDTFLNLTDKQIKEHILSVMDEYIEKKLGGLENKSKRFKYLFIRCSNAATILIKHIIKELSQSDFKPMECEKEISENSDLKPLTIKLPDDSLIEVEGKIDRVDTMSKDGKTYVRIIDYKTGNKTFKLSDILYGLNMQMMIYMLTIKSSDEKKYNSMIPAGILYMPAITPTVNLEDDDTESKANLKVLKKMRMNGLVLDNPEVVIGMEEEAKGIFIPAVVKDGKVKKSESIANLAQMGIIMKYIEKLIIEMAQNLRNGQVSSRPISGEYDSCEWCPYGAICGYEDGMNTSIIKNMGKEDALKKMLSESENENEQ